MGAQTSVEQRRLRKSPFGVHLTVIVVGALLLRIAYVVALRHHALSGDGFSYWLAAIDLRHGHGFVDPLSKALPASAHHPPAWTLLLTIPQLLGSTSLLSSQVFATLVGAATVVVVGLVGRRITSDRGGLIAAVLAALYPGLWVYEQELLSETLLFLGVGLLILAAYSYQGTPTRGRAIALGAACGVAALIRSEQLLLVVALVVPVVLGGRHINRKRLGSLALAGVTVVLVIMPWTLYNLSRLDTPVVLSTGFGAAMAQGNCATAYSGPLLGYYDFNCLGPTIKKASERGSKDPFGDAALRREAIRYMTDHASRLPVVSLARQGRTWSLYKPFQTSDLEALFPKALTWPHRLALFFYWALLPFAAIGLLALRRRHVSLLPLVAPFIVTAVTVAATYGDPRLRAGAAVPLVLLAAAGIERLSTRGHAAEPATSIEASPVALTEAE